MINVKVQGTYNTNEKNVIDFTFSEKIPSCPETWINSMIQKRFLPFWIKKDKNHKKGFSSLSYCLVTDWSEDNKPDDLVGKDILSMSEYEIQQLACKFLLTEIPLPFQFPIKVLREKAVLEYLKRVKDIPIDTEEDKLKLAFYKKSPDGGWVADLSEQECYVEDIKINYNNISVDEPIKKMTLAEIAGKTLPSAAELTKE